MTSLRRLPLLILLLLLPTARHAQDTGIPTVAPEDGQIDGTRIPAYAFAWQSYRVGEDGEQDPLAVWYDTTTVVAGEGGEVLRRVQWIVPEEGEPTILLNEADRATLLPLRTSARPADGEPFIDLRFAGTRVSGTRPILPHNGSPAEAVRAEFELELPEPAYDWRWWGILIAALPLESDYEARFLAFATETNVGSPLIWITARDTGEGRVGSVACWVVEVQAGAPWTLWIARDRDGPPVHRIRIEQPDGSAVVWEPFEGGG